MEAMAKIPWHPTIRMSILKKFSDYWKKLEEWCNQIIQLKSVSSMGVTKLKVEQALMLDIIPIILMILLIRIKPMHLARLGLSASI